MTDAILRLCLPVRGQPTALTLLSIYSTPIWLYISFLSCCLCLPRELPWLFQYLATYLPACLPTCLPACLACLACLTCLSYLPTDLPTDLCLCLCSGGLSILFLFLPIRQSNYMASDSSYLPTSHLPTYLSLAWHLLVPCFQSEYFSINTKVNAKAVQKGCFRGMETKVTIQCGSTLHIIYCMYLNVSLNFINCSKTCGWPRWC